MLPTGSNPIQRGVFIGGPALPWYQLSRGIVCLHRQFDRMRSISAAFPSEACDRRRLRSVTALNQVSESMVDAFGHCWIGCEGGRRCGRSMTHVLGRSHEWMREYTPLRGEHNSYEEDVANQAEGRRLSAADAATSCAVHCSDAAETGRLREHLHSTRCYDCGRHRWTRRCSERF